MFYIKVCIISIIIVTILNIFLKSKTKFLVKKINCSHYLVGYILTLYFTITLIDFVGFPFLQEWKRLYNLSGSLFNPNLNLIPFNDGLDISNILNILLFIPCGFLLPVLWKKYHTFSNILFYSLLFSTIIEVGQLFTRCRATDINDLIMNTLGSLLGWSLFKIIKNKFPNFSNKSMINYSNNNNYFIRLEPYFYIIISVFSSFLFYTPY
jgi:glycopeptide antibiotics resistance protein